jgi:hypothetical protein
VRRTRIKQAGYSEELASESTVSGQAKHNVRENQEIILCFLSYQGQFSQVMWLKIEKKQEIIQNNGTILVQRSQYAESIYFKEAHFQSIILAKPTLKKYSLSIPKYSSFWFFFIKFDHSSYSK